jgi:hypothetical protein
MPQVEKFGKYEGTYRRHNAGYDSQTDKLQFC